MVIKRLIADRMPWTRGDNPCSTGPALLLSVLWYNANTVFEEKYLYLLVSMFKTSGLQIIIVMQVEINLCV